MRPPETSDLDTAGVAALAKGAELEAETERLREENLRLNCSIAAHNLGGPSAPGYAEERARLEREKTDHARRCADLLARKEAHRQLLDDLTTLKLRAVGASVH